MVFDVAKKLFGLVSASVLNIFHMANMIFKSDDLAFLFFVALGLALIGFFIGEAHLALVIISIYLSYFVFYFLPVNVNFLNLYNLSFYYRLFIFASVVLVIYLLLSNFFRFSFRNRSASGILRVILLSISGALLFGVLLSNFITSDADKLVSDFAKKYLFDNNWRFVWIILPILIIGFRRGKRRYNRSGNNEDND